MWIPTGCRAIWWGSRLWCPKVYRAICWGSWLWFLKMRAKSLAIGWGRV